MRILTAILFMLLFVSRTESQFIIDLPPQAPPLPDVTVELKDVIDILTEYNVVLEDNPSFCSMFYGMTDYQARTISICAIYEITQRRRTVLHEIMHIVYWQKGIETGGPYEEQIQERADRLFYKLYGIPPGV